MQRKRDLVSYVVNLRREVVALLFGNEVDKISAKQIDKL